LDDKLRGKNNGVLRKLPRRVQFQLPKKSPNRKRCQLVILN
jgi:hypothetical protein